MTYKTLIDAATLQSEYQKGAWQIFDCRSYLTDQEKGRLLYQTSHIPDAHFFDMESDLSSQITETSGRHPLPDFETLAQKLGGCGVEQGVQVVVYDDMQGAMAARLWWLLRYMGHGDVAVLDGGLQAWQAINGKMTDSLPKSSVGDFAIQAPFKNTSYLSTIDIVKQFGRLQIVDARAKPRFLGEVEPIDPVAGHIPGAINWPFQENLAEDGRFKSQQQLAHEWAELVDLTQPVVHMCGSGVTACHNMLAMSHAGFDNSILYAGSWSEWIRDEARPISMEDTK
jgi:thiosulfate/3-mercaptopyruvate sulfurtransferase